ncbi:MAG: three-Cys-motif partner protein TcmP [Alphaproteobacteria bacterium]|nr:three-Cys-motif partner protein TcmP [Alphaproteobacteria bacterium]
MANKNTDFFKKKHDWSIIKDELLGWYLAPYFAKVLQTNKPILYIDCFAGKGKFEDGADGSPLIALKIKKQTLERTTATNPQITTGFIDANHADDLKANIVSYFPDNTKLPVIDGKYEEHIENALKNKGKANVFLYIDPYGIKALDYNMLTKFANSDFNSIELLINLNSFGFLRDGCRVLKVKEMEDFSSELVEYEPTEVKADDESTKLLNSIAGGDYWQQIIRDYNDNKIDMYRAEKIFSFQYKEKLREKYKYVVDMPLRLKSEQLPKYRMVHASNHPDACVLMAENISSKAKELVFGIRRKGQRSLFDMSADSDIITIDEIKDGIKKVLDKFTTDTHLNEVLATFFSDYGVICNVKDVKDVMEEMEKVNEIKVSRIPDKTDKGAKTTFFSEHGKNQVMIGKVLGKV